MNKLNEFETSTLKRYFQNIIAACNNTEVDERPYIKSVAESGLEVINGLFKKL